MGKYALPESLKGKTTPEAYKRWLYRKAQAHVGRDREYGNADAIGDLYRAAIHAAVIEGGDLDAYTGEPLDWSLISKWDNEKAKEGKRDYRRKFAMMPTIDHVGDRRGKPVFKICSYRTNDAKSDMNLSEFKALCRKVLKIV